MALLNYKGKNIVTVCLVGGTQVTLMPGVNEVDNNVFNLFKTHPLVKVRLQSGDMQILDESKVVADSPQDEILERIPRIFDTKLLRKIIKEEQRPEVTRAAKDQLDIILGKSNKEAKKDSDEHFR